jgi:hypothetical protein
MTIRKRRLTAYALDKDILEYFLEYLYRKKYLKNILKKNDKLSPYYVIIDIRGDNTTLDKIIKRKFKNNIVLR